MSLIIQTHRRSESDDMILQKVTLQRNQLSQLGERTREPPAAPPPGAALCNSGSGNHALCVSLPLLAVFVAHNQELRFNRLIPEQTAFQVISRLFWGLSVVTEEGTGALSAAKADCLEWKGFREWQAGCLSGLM